MDICTLTKLKFLVVLYAYLFMLKIAIKMNIFSPVVVHIMVSAREYAEVGEPPLDFGVRAFTSLPGFIGTTASLSPSPPSLRAVTGYLSCNAQSCSYQ